MEESYLAETAALQIIDSKRKAKPFCPTRYPPFYSQSTLDKMQIFSIYLFL